MLFKTASALAFLAVAAQAVDVFQMSSHDIFGLERRQGSGSYQPTQTFCGAGNTCSEACGKGYATCPSVDNAIHCYNSDAKQACCPDGTGNSCDTGFYCAASPSNGTLCCAAGQSVGDCAKAYGVYSLTSEAPAPTSYPTYAMSSTTTPCTSTYGASMTYPAVYNTTKPVYPTSSPTKVAVSGAGAIAPGVALFAAAALAALL